MFALLLAACSSVHHAVQPFDPPSSESRDLNVVLSQPVDLEVEVLISATWEVPRSGLLDLSHPKTKTMKDEPVPIHLPIVRIRHPDAGTFFVDTGVDRSMARGEDGPVRGLLKSYLEELRPQMAFGELIDAEPEVGGVLLTHMHLDHVLGLPDVPHDVPVFTGESEGSERSFENLFVRSTLAAALGDRPPLTQFPSEARSALGGWKGAIDLLGDGAIWALPAPGHTSGSTVYLLNAATPTLVLGDASHTCWGWQNDVPPGTFSHDPEQAAKTFAALRTWAAQIDGLEVVAGHTPCEDDS